MRVKLYLYGQREACYEPVTRILFIWENSQRPKTYYSAGLSDTWTHGIDNWYNLYRVNPILFKELPVDQEEILEEVFADLI